MHIPASRRGGTRSKSQPRQDKTRRTGVTSRRGQSAAVSSSARAFFTPARALPSRLPSTLLFASAVRVHHDSSSASKTTFCSFRVGEHANNKGSGQNEEQNRSQG